MPKNQSETKHKNPPKHKAEGKPANPSEHHPLDPENSTLVYVNHKPQIVEASSEHLTDEEKSNLVVMAKKGKLFPTSLTESQIKQRLFLDKVSGRSPGTHASQTEHGGSAKKKGG